MNLSKACFLFFAVVLSNCLSEASAVTPVVQWVSQYNVATAIRNEMPYSVSADSLGNIFIGGRINTQGGFVAKYTSDGAFQWFQGIDHTFENTKWDTINDVKADGIGNVYATGKKFLTGVTMGHDVLLQKFDSAGVQQWSNTIGSSSFEDSFGVTVSGPDNVYVSGTTHGSLFGSSAGDNDVFVAKFNSAGTSQWSKQFGTTAADSAYGIGADILGSLLLSGTAQGSFPGQAGTGLTYVKKFDASGSEQWTKRFGGNSTPEVYNMTVDTLGNAFITGTVLGNFGGASAGLEDVFLSKLDANGTLQWTKQFGTSGTDIGASLATDGLGNVFLAYNTKCSFGTPGNSNLFYGDPAVRKYGADGTILWDLPLGTASKDSVIGISTDGLGNLYATGYTAGNYGGPVSGGDDIFLVKIAEVPEPNNFSLIAVGLCGIVAGRMRRSQKLKSLRL